MSDNFQTDAAVPAPDEAANQPHPPASTPASPQPNPSEMPPAGDDPATIQAELAALRAKNVELSDQYLRAQADMQNTRRRAEEEAAKARKFAIESFAESLLPVCDSLEAGLAHENATPEQIREGAEATLRQLRSALERNRVTAIDPSAGSKFDPHQHQAISMVPAEQEPGTVVSVLQKGYTIADRVLRPALVTVAQAR
ncbi:MAG TPA: nucleotide exchange factor GrpE [Ramlibacter sp.]|uniref:nucleotide exchange factor GrpE n=1 Tax=Ramlibacter sp. TaxID=1917967 RepID=UPI002CADC560|nr:nucleotide exchange factor GrpE [Ramlibacter sp.]HVZ45663.1 nucleotide exchange factor GrpE [Ramlibacter sp.]